MKPTSQPPVSQTQEAVSGSAGSPLPILCGVSMYVCSVGAAAAITVFDGIVNEKSAVLMKTGGWFSRVFAGSNQAGIWFLLALVFFCLFSALVTFAYKPKEAKEAFILGASVLAMLNALVKPPSGTPIALQSMSPALTVGGINFISSAFAQESIKPSGLGTLWIGVHGVLDHDNPQTNIIVYDARTGLPVQNIKARLGGKVALAYGKYNVELNRRGYRSVVFQASVDGAANLYQPRLEAVQLDGLANLFGPRTIDLPNNKEMARSLNSATEACASANIAGARAVLVRLKSNEREKFTSDPLLERELCWR